MLLTLSNCYFSPLAEYPFQSLGEGNKKKEKPLFPPFPNPSGGSLRILFSRNRLLPLGGCLHRLPPCTPLCKPCCSIILEGLSLKFSLTGRLATQTRFLKTSKTWWKNRHPLLPFQQVLGRENSQQFSLVIIYSTQLRNLLENVSRVAKRRNETLVWNYYFFFCNCVHFMPEKTVVKNPIALGASWGGGRDEDIPVPSSSEACWSCLPIEFDTMTCRWIKLSPVLNRMLSVGG